MSLYYVQKFLFQLNRDPARQQALLREADRLRDQAQELRKKQQAGAAG